MNKRQYKKLKVVFHPDSGFTIGSGAREEKEERKSWRKIRHLYVVHGFNVHGRRFRQCAKALKYRLRRQEGRYCESDVETLNYFYGESLAGLSEEEIFDEEFAF